MAKSANDEVWMDWPAGDVLGIRKKDRLGNTVRAAVCARDGYRCRYCGVVCMDAPSRGQYLRTGPWPTSFGTERLAREFLFGCSTRRLDVSRKSSLPSAGLHAR